ncbi:OmpA family protein [Acidisphaera rubrifaciens]|uniref:Outer membrane protein OmpA n=1 Tax=Acidisphaera rubrifaciens HS-AP3 TaxID=1231350 RepID=A0A0D6P6K7_9PROT|nr:OmpA family protein [Acidisphaera rubrifaciens]GAN77400.1 outer membrane protein OmpA [Acidisphaera rubrifaciens HS-AP3]
MTTGWTRAKPLLLATALAAMPAVAWAQPFQGVYVGLGGGYNWRDEIDTKTPASPFALGNQVRLNDANGYVGLGSIGYGFGNGLRLEVEGNFRGSEAGGFAGTAFPTTGGGRVQTYGGMVNALFDMDIGLPWLYPYIGVGAGYAATHLDGVYGSGIGTPYLLRADGTQGNFAFQAIAGLSFPVPDVPGLSLTTEYRFFGVFGDNSYAGTMTTPAGYGATAPRTSGPTTLTLRNEYNQGVLIGLRYAFGIEPPPAPAPAAPPVAAPARSYLVFFDWDRANLTERARQIIHEAAENSTKVQYTRIEVNGYTDTSGTRQYNQGLSIRRAQAVAAELVRDGVPRQSITIQGFGETHLLVPTGPGVREAQNRRVEIVIK